MHLIYKVMLNSQNSMNDIFYETLNNLFSHSQLASTYLKCNIFLFIHDILKI